MLRRPDAASSIVPTRIADHVVHEGVGRTAKAEDLALVLQRCGEDIALEVDVVGLGWGKGGEVVAAAEGGGAGIEHVAVNCAAATKARGRARRGSAPDGLGIR